MIPQDTHRDIMNAVVRLKQGQVYLQLLFIDYFINVESQTRSVPQLPTSTSASIQAGYKKSTFGEAAQLCLQPTERNVQTP